MEIDELTWINLMELVKGLREGVIVAQAEATAARELANLLLADLARLQPDPKTYLDEAYERVCAKVDPLVKGGGKTAMADARLLLDRAFRDAGGTV